MFMIPKFPVITMENNHDSSFYKPPPPPPSACKFTFMCSYGGKFQLRPHDNRITYVASDNKILSVDRYIKLPALVAKLASLTGETDFGVKYQLPGDDLNALVSVTNDEDLHHMMFEYDRLSRTSPRHARLRLFLIPLNNNSGNASSCSCSSSAPSTTTEPKQWYEEALNLEASAPAAHLPSPAVNLDFLLGLDYAKDAAAVSECGQEAVREPQIQERSNKEQLLHRKNDDVAAPLITHATTQVHSEPVQFPGPVQGNGYDYPPVFSARATEPGPVYLIQTPSGMYQAFEPVIGPEGQPVYFNLCLPAIVCAVLLLPLYTLL